MTKLARRADDVQPGLGVEVHGLCERVLVGQRGQLSPQLCANKQNISHTTITPSRARLSLPHASPHSSTIRAYIAHKREPAICTPQRVHRVWHTIPAHPIANRPKWILYKVGFYDMLGTRHLSRNTLC